MNYSLKISANIIDSGIKCLKFFGINTSRSREYDFILNNIYKPKIKILDVGSTGSLLPLKLAKKGYSIWTIDTREYHEKHPNMISDIMDINEANFLDESFDLITCVSVLEHIGMSAYGDPVYENGDKLVIKKFYKILKDTGRLLLTVPFSGIYKILPWKETYERIYDYDHIMELFKDWKFIKEEYYFPKNKKNWLRCDRKNAERIHLPYIRSNLACYILEK